MPAPPVAPGPSSWRTGLEAASRRLLARRWRDLLALAALVGVALCWAGPAFHEGWFFGSYDLVLHFGLGHGLFPAIHNTVDGDTARQGAVWTLLDWKDVHAGRLPLWDPDIVLGLPLAPNLQSAPASLPTLLGYLVPLRWAYTVGVLTKLVVGGFGCYLAARVLGVSRSGALLAGVVGELAGPMAAWSGWPQAGVAEWTGWLVAGAVLVAESPSRRRVAGLAAVVAFACAGGFPEMVVILAVGLVVVCLFLLAPAVRAHRRAGFEPLAPRWRRLVALLGATALGGLLAAPLWLPSLPVLARSVSRGRAAPVLGTAQELWLFLDPSYWGLPTTSSLWFGPLNFYETAAFVGPAVVALAAVALLCRPRDTRVLGLLAGAVVLFVFALGPTTLVSAEHHLPDLGSVAFGRGLLVIGDLLGILAAVGIDEARRRSRRSLAASWLGLAAVAVPFFLLLTGAGALTAPERAIRLHGAALAGAGLAALALLVLALTAGRRWGRRLVASPRWRRRLLAAGGLFVVAVEAGSLVLASAGNASWVASYLPTNPGIQAAAADAQGGLIALGGAHPGGDTTSLGLLADLNAAYGLRELAAYDGVIPRALEQAWAREAPAPDLAAAEVSGDVTSFEPEVTTEPEARALGVEYLLEPNRPPLRLVDRAGTPLAADLRAAKVGGGAATVTGLLDDLEWLTEEPALQHAYPLRRPGGLADYLTALAGPGVTPAEPAALGPPAAKAVAPLLAKDPRLLAELERLLTSAPPSGAELVARFGGEALYRFASLAGASFADPGAGRVTAALRYGSDAAASFAVQASRPAWVLLGMDAEPGWTATAGGRVLPLSRAEGGAVLEVKVPAGASTVQLHYWPKYLTLGAWLAVLAVVVLLVLLVGSSGVGTIVRRRGEDS